MQASTRRATSAPRSAARFTRRIVPVLNTSPHEAQAHVFARCERGLCARAGGAPCRQRPAWPPWQPSSFPSAPLVSRWGPIVAACAAEGESALRLAGSARPHTAGTSCEGPCRLWRKIGPRQRTFLASAVLPAALTSCLDGERGHPAAADSMSRISRGRCLRGGGTTYVWILCKIGHATHAAAIADACCCRRAVAMKSGCMCCLLPQLARTLPAATARGGFGGWVGEGGQGAPPAPEGGRPPSSLAAHFLDRRVAKELPAASRIVVGGTVYFGPEQWRARVVISPPPPPRCPQC